MRRIALLGLTLLLPACQTMVGNPLNGAGGFVGDTETYRLNPNRPVGASPNMARVMGKQVDTAPLTTEPGDVWPGPIAPEPTLQDIERQQNQSELTGQPPPPRPPRHGSAVPPGSPPALPPGPAPQAAPTPPAMPSAPPPSMQIYQTPQGPDVGTQSGNGVQTYTDPNGGMGIVVPNANGTSTLIGPNGATSVPTPR
jgi:hypothetical protein